MKIFISVQIQQTEQRSNNNTQRTHMSVNSLQTVKADNRADLETVSVLHLEINT